MTLQPEPPLRPDLQVIADMVPIGCRLLDVGCADGALLAWLGAHKRVDGRGIELSREGVSASIKRGLSVVQGDADTDLRHYPDGAYDYVVLSQTLQTMRDPKTVLANLVRIGKRVIVSVPNFGYWKNRFYLLWHGEMPVTKTLAYAWYDTPNIHFCTINDFLALCRMMRIALHERVYADARGLPGFFQGRPWLANLIAEQGIFLLSADAT